MCLILGLGFKFWLFQFPKLPIKASVELCTNGCDIGVTKK
jgi:hypothetical protein